MNGPALASVAAAFDALDLAAENEQIASLTIEVANAETAIETATARRREIAAELGAMTRPLSKQAGGGEGARVADALLEGYGASTSTTAVASAAELDREAAGLALAIGELRRRIEDRRREIGAVQSRARHKAHDLARPLIEALTDDAREAAGRIIEANAAVQALSLATRSACVEGVQLGKVVETMTRTVSHQPLLQRRERTMPVPAEIARLLARLDSKGAALNLHVPKEVPLF